MNIFFFDTPARYMIDHRTSREKRLGNQHRLHTKWNHESLACIERVYILDKYPGVCQRQKLHIS